MATGQLVGAGIERLEAAVTDQQTAVHGLIAALVALFGAVGGATVASRTAGRRTARRPQGGPTRSQERE